MDVGLQRGCVLCRALPQEKEKKTQSGTNANKGLRPVGPAVFVRVYVTAHAKPTATSPSVCMETTSSGLSAGTAPTSVLPETR